MIVEVSFFHHTPGYFLATVIYDILQEYGPELKYQLLVSCAAKRVQAYAKNLARHEAVGFRASCIISGKVLKSFAPMCRQVADMVCIQQDSARPQPHDPFVVNDGGGSAVGQPLAGEFSREPRRRCDRAGI